MSETRYVRNQGTDHIHVETKWRGMYHRTLCGSVLPGELVEKPQRICRACTRAEEHRRQTKA